MMMRSLRKFWLGLFDVRPGERARVVGMALYLLCVLFAYYIIKVASYALFLNKFDVDKVPILQMLVAVVGGVVAAVYTKVAVQASLKKAVTWTMAISVASLIAFWILIPAPNDPRANKAFASVMLYVFSVWTSMFSITTVSQGWLVAANVFDTREAKRVYGPILLAAVVGALMGGEFTNLKVRSLGTRNLLWASVIMVVLAWFAFLFTASRKGVSLAGKRAATKEESFRFREIPANIGRHRHLQVIIGMMLMMFMVDSVLMYQFSAQAKLSFKGDELTAFLGIFTGRYLNLLTFTLQFFLTVPLVRAVGVGGTLQAMPIAMVAVSAATAAAPNLWTTSIARVTEPATRYTVNRTGTELLYVPLPVELKNRTKAFIDIFIDRFGRGLGGLLLLLLISIGLASPRQIALASLVLSAIWIVLATVARKEYVKTVRKRLEARRLDLESLRVELHDPVTLGLLETALKSPNPRQVRYGLTLLADAPDYDLRPRLAELAVHPADEVRTEVYRIARALKFEGALQPALTQVWASTPGQDGSVKPAVAYILALSTEARRLTKLFLDHPNWFVAQGALEALQRESAADFVTNEWLVAAAQDGHAERRAIAALAVGVRGDQGTEILYRLLEDSDAAVVTAACRAAGSVQNRAYLPALVRRLAQPRYRAVAIEALASFSVRICGSLGDMIGDERLAIATRRQIPRVLALIPDQRSADVLLHFIGNPEITIRAAVLRALNRLRKTAPDLDYGRPVVTRQILEEARHYFQLASSLDPFRENTHPGTAAGLLARTIEERLKQTLERLFRLLGLRYPPQQIYNAYLAVNSRRTEEYAAALEFLESVMDRELKRVVMPVFESTSRQAGLGRDLFGLETLDAEGAVRELIRSTDPWIKACAMATAAEQRFQGLRDEISEAAQHAGADVSEVARSAVAALR